MIRPAKPGDSEAVLVLTKDFATSFVTDEAAFHRSYVALLTDDTAYLGVAELDGEVVGYVLALAHPTLYANGPVAWVEEIMVEASCRRDGVGGALMESVEVWAAQRGCALVALATRRAAGFYEGIGYVRSAEYFRRVL